MLIQKKTPGKNIKEKIGKIHLVDK